MIEVSIILPVYNGEQWLEECLQSILQQTFNGSMEVSVFNDASTDSSLNILEEFQTKFDHKNIKMVLSGHSSKNPKGVGYAKNRAVEQSCGKFLCFLDADDVMHDRRIEQQYLAAQDEPNSIVGCCFVRDPVDSTERYTKWANEISQTQLYTQVYTSHGPTVLMPTWFCTRDVFLRVGHFDESGKGCPEDLIFFYEHLHKGGDLYRVDEKLLTYRYHQQAASFSVHEDTIWDLRIKFFQERVLDQWDHFTIWNAGKQGRKFFRSLSRSNQRKVKTFCDVDEKKISKGVYTYEESKETPKPKIPIVHYNNAQPPFVLCVKQDLTGGAFEEILASLNLMEGTDYYHFG